MKKQLGWGSLPLLLFLFAIVWNYSIFDFCFGDQVLEMLGLPSWSLPSHLDSTISIVSYGPSGIHYTIFYSVLFLLPAVYLGFRYPDHLFAIPAKWMSLLLLILLLISPLLMLF